MNEFDPEDAVEEFIERDSSMGSGYDRRWEVPHMIYSCPELGGFEGGHLAVGEDHHLGGPCFACPASVTRCPLYDPRKLELVPS